MSFFVWHIFYLHAGDHTSAVLKMAIVVIDPNTLPVSTCVVKQKHTEKPPCIEDRIVIPIVLEELMVHY